MIYNANSLTKEDQEQQDNLSMWKKSCVFTPRIRFISLTASVATTEKDKEVECTDRARDRKMFGNIIRKCV